LLYFDCDSIKTVGPALDNKRYEELITIFNQCLFINFGRQFEKAAVRQQLFNITQICCVTSFIGIPEGYPSHIVDLQTGYLIF